MTTLRILVFSCLVLSVNTASGHPTGVGRHTLWRRALRANSPQISPVLGISGENTARHLQVDGKGEWEFCVENLECTNSCCSSEYSGDGRFKCTPGGCDKQSKPAQKGPKHDTDGEGGKQDKKGTKGTKHDTDMMGKGEWEFCSVNSECANSCCSNKYSGDGKLKCTPGGC